MPEPSWHEDCLTRVLYELNQLKVLAAVLLLDFGEYLNEVVDGFVIVVFMSEFPSFDDGLGHILSK